MKGHELLVSYVGSLETGDPDQILKHFAERAQVHSPLYGDLPAPEFFAEMLAHTGRSETRIRNVFTSQANPRAAAVHFTYHWTLADGTPAHLEVVDVFRLSEDCTGIDDLTIIHDTARLRYAIDRSADDGGS